MKPSYPSFNTGRPADRINFSFTLNDAILNASIAGRTLQPFFISAVAVLEDLLLPYSDDIYEDEIKTIEDKFNNASKNLSQSNLAILIWQKMREKMRALIGLAKRNRFLIEESAIADEGMEEENASENDEQTPIG